MAALKSDSEGLSFARLTRKCVWYVCVAAAFLSSSFVYAILFRGLWKNASLGFLSEISGAYQELGKPWSKLLSLSINPLIFPLRVCH